MRSVLLAGLMGSLMTMAAVNAQAAELSLTPADTRIGLTIYAMGMFPQSGHFSRFTGTLRVDPGHPESCHVDLKVEIASLAMSTQTATRMSLGPSMLDAAHFPTLSYQGSCNPAHTVGKLTLHGITDTLTLTATRAAGTITANGSLRRQDYAVLGMTGLVGSTVNIVFAVDLPPALAQSFSR